MGIQIIWMLQEDRSFSPGDATTCRGIMDSRGATSGLCVGDGQTMGQTVPSMSTFNDSPFAIGRGYDMLISRSDMIIRDVSTHGTPAGNDNLTGPELVERLRMVIAGL